MYYFINLIKFIASGLVINSHLDNVYPTALLASGGQFGNALFFASTGFLLAGSLSRKNEDFAHWYAKKFLRIYVPAFLIILVSYIYRTPAECGLFNELVRLFRYWFFRCLLLLYIPFYFVYKNPTKKKKMIAATVAAVVYLGWYFIFKDITNHVLEDGTRFRWFFSFLVMMLGAELRFFCDKNSFPIKLLPSAILFFCGFVAFFAMKVLMVIKPETIPFQLLLQPCVIAVVVGLFGVAYAFENKLKRFLTDNAVGKIINKISYATMESFLLTDFVIGAILLINLPFYMAVPLCFVIVWAGAVLLNNCLKPYNRLISKI